MSNFYGVENKYVEQLIRDAVDSACDLHNDGVVHDNVVYSSIEHQFSEIKRLSVVNFNIMLCGDDVIYPENTPKLIVHAISKYVNDKVLLKSDKTATIVQ